MPVHCTRRGFYLCTTESFFLWNRSKVPCWCCCGHDIWNVYREIIQCLLKSTVFYHWWVVRLRCNNFMLLNVCLSPLNKVWGNQMLTSNPRWCEDVMNLWSLQQLKCITNHGAPASGYLKLASGKNLCNVKSEHNEQTSLCLCISPPIPNVCVCLSYYFQHVCCNRIFLEFVPIFSLCRC